MREDLATFFDELSLSSLSACFEDEARSLQDISAEAARDRVGFLQYLKERGVDKLPDR